MIPNIPPKLFTLSAVAIGYLLIDDMTANEQNAAGNWLMLVAQVLCTNAFYKQVQAERNTQPMTNEQSIIILEKMMRAMKTEINELKSQIKK